MFFEYILLHNYEFYKLIYLFIYLTIPNLMNFIARYSKYLSLIVILKL